MRLTFNINDGAQTRSITADNENTVSDITILVFDAGGSLIGSKYVSPVSPAPVDISVTARSATGCTIYAIANIGPEGYFAGVNTIDKLNAMYTTIGSPADLENNGSTAGSTGAMMIGHIDVPTIDSGTNQFTIPLYHQCGKFSFTIKPATGVTITGYQLCHVPLSSYITDSHVPVSPPPAGTGSYNDFAAVTGLTQTTDLSKTYYIYENLCGSSNSVTDEKSRNSSNAPTSASYLLVNAKGTGWTSTYRIYLGGMTNTATPATDLKNFNVYRNLNYNCTINLGASGGNGDARVTYTATAPSTRSNMYMGDAPIGNYLYADGTNGTTFISGQTVGIIFSSEVTLAQYNAGCRHGRVLALKNANSGNYCYWANAYNSPYTDHSSTGHLYATTLKTSFDDVSSGYDALSANSSYVGTNTNYAWYYCKNYSDGTTKSFTNSGWYLPSAGEWWDFMENLGTWTVSDKTTLKTMHTSTTSLVAYVTQSLTYNYFSDLNAKLTAAGGNTIVPGSGAYYFWSASEIDDNRAAVIVLVGSNYVNVYVSGKTGSNYYVRAVLAY
ncbi:hypothetical protein prwr041_25950 [Prevotella herbatica]|uniref:Fibrobacter succinogenes major paralogous domain-containing protein n=1 Tax=Prevotella herbatica TaxID=2801997 RepID=A0ABM7P1U5_9BACT|nr:hypothetical protein prwr041_25950 [Prevotella herbatica]